MYTMAKSRLRLSDKEFWNMAPKTFFAMLSEYNDIENALCYKMAIAHNGEKLPESEKAHKPAPPAKVVNPFFF
jgi:hypothetical protein